MAKGKLTPQQQQAAAGAEFDKLSKIQNEWDKLLSKKQKGQKFDEDRLKQLEKEFRTYNTLANKVDKIADAHNELNKKIKEFNDELDDTLNNFDDLDDSFVSIGKTIGKNSKLY
jgi:seryl-tRNA synthetase